MSKNRKNVRYIPFLGIDARYLGYLKLYRPLLAASVILIFMVAGLEALAPWPIKIVVDHVLKEEPFANPIWQALVIWVEGDRRVLAVIIGLGLLGVTLLQGLATFTFQFIDGVIKERSAVRLQADAFRHVQTLSVHYFNHTRQGGILKRVNDDATRVMTALVSSLGDFLLNTVMFIGFAVIMLVINWRFSFIVLAYVPLLLYVFITFRRNIRATAKEARTYEGEMMNLTLETLGAIREVKAFGQETVQQARFEHKGQERLRAGLRSLRWDASFDPVIDFIQALSTAAVIWYGVSQVLAGHMTVGDLLVFMAYMKSMYSPLRKFSRLTGDVQKAAAGGDRLAELLDTQADIQDIPNARPMQLARGQIVFENVQFTYPESQTRPVLQDFNLRVEPGQIVALVGHTGAGKSTVLNLLLRFYDLTGGRLTLDGHDLRSLRMADLRNQISVVPQEPVLFAATVRENIAFGRPEASEQEILRAAQAANADEFIQRLPQGYATLLGERGATLSGGQRQRLAIARALLRNTPILILDEPTAALDAGSEKLVMDALERLMQGRTTFIIAHRLSTIRKAHQIIVLDQGHIIERGTHAELIQKNGSYAEMVSLQTHPQKNGLPASTLRPMPAL
ncbi:MAG: ABC transporter ATP-binding protein [Anaerolineales bacterium]|nr:ABC transporter ATP-binding protein [Anaerolineales bacterium]